MIMFRGERRKVVMMACGELYRLKPNDTGATRRQGETMTRSQLAKAAREYYLEGK
jgi:hypothetical protein